MATTRCYTCNGTREELVAYPSFSQWQACGTCSGTGTITEPDPEPPAPASAPNVRITLTITMVDQERIAA